MIADMAVALLMQALLVQHAQCALRFSAVWSLSARVRRVSDLVCHPA
jgi:hypothetical protein